jgi:hydroxymethylbilane synthase
MQIRSDDEQLREIVNAINDFDTRLALRAEREFLRLLNADCNQPVGVVAVVDETIMKIRGQIFALGATTPREGSVQGPSADAEKLAARLLEQIRSRA